MTRHLVGWTIAIALCCSASLAQVQREREAPKKPGGKPAEAGSTPGGDWSARTHSGKISSPQSGFQHNESAATGTTAANKTKQPTGAQGAPAGATAANRNQPQYSGAEGAAAGAATANRNQPQYSGAEGAAAGAAAANRNQPQYSGAEGAAVGAAAANRNQPQLSGAQGAALGAAAANNNQNQYSAAQGAAVGAAVANNNQPPSSGAAALGAAVANSNQPQYSDPQAAAASGNLPAAAAAVSPAAGYEAVRNSFNASNVYRPQWWRDHPETWVPTGWVVGAAWQPTPWAAIAGLCGYGSAAPLSYDYGVNVTAQNGNVFVNGQSVGTTAEFSQQAATLALTGDAAQVTTADQWLPLGVFAMVRNEREHPQLIVQLAINKQGILRGNYIDELTESTLPIRARSINRPSGQLGSSAATNKPSWKLASATLPIPRPRHHSQERQDRSLALGPPRSTEKSWVIWPRWI